MIIPSPDFTHVLAMTDEHGTYEHADHAVPRREHGYCTDDVARVLLLAARQTNPTAEVTSLARQSLRFIADAQSRVGDCRNRRDHAGRWLDAPSVKDCWGRSMWGLGVAAAASDEWLSSRALNLFERGATQRSTWVRATAFASLGAASVLAVASDNRRARALLEDAAQTLSFEPSVPEWRWPEARLSYANAAVPEAMLAIGAALERPELVRDGLAQLGWLLERETLDGHLSVTPVGGAGPGDPAGRFDQQPIEVAAMADACARAYALTAEPRWADGVHLAMGWFLGENDAGQVMWDPRTGGGFDGLERGGVNLNQGAESTLAFLSTCQQANALVVGIS